MKETFHHCKYCLESIFGNAPKYSRHQMVCVWQQHPSHNLNLDCAAMPSDPIVLDISRQQLLMCGTPSSSKWNIY